MIFRHWWTPLRRHMLPHRAATRTGGKIIMIGRDFEQFEERVLPSVSWVGSVSNNWNVAGNWSNDAVPTSTTDVSISTSAAATIVIVPAEVESINSLMLDSNDTLSITGGSLAIAANSTIAGNLSLTGGGTLTAAAGLANSGTIAISAASTFTVDGSFSQSTGATLSLPGGGLPSIPAANLLTNSDFESPGIPGSGTTPTGWNSWGSTSLSNQYAFSGAQSVQSSGPNSGMLQSFAVTPGASYTLSADAMTPAANPLTGSEGAYLELLFYNASGAQLSPYSPPNSVLVVSSSSAPGGPLTGSVGNQGWILVSTTAVAPAGAATVDVFLAVGAYNGSGAGGGTVYWDNAQFGPSLPGPSKFVAGSISNNGTITVGPTNSVTTSGAFTQTSTGTLDLQLGGAPATGYYGSVKAATATLAGTLESDILYGYVPSTTDVFVPMTFASESGAFASYQLPSGSGYQFDGAVTFTNVVVSAVPSSPLTTTVNAASTIGNVTTNLLGINLTWWDSSVPTTQTQTLVENAGLTQYRFPGGGSSDDYHFNVAANFGDSSADTIPQFAEFIQSVGGIGTITLDFGSGSPQEAAAELAYLQGSPTDTTQIGVGIEWSDSASQWQSVNWGTVGYWASLRASSPLTTNDGLNFLRINHLAPFTDIKYWEVGNEEYGSWEIDHHGTAGPGGVSTGAQHSPATYAAFAETFAGLAQTILGDAGLPGVSIGIDSEDPTGAADNNWTKNVLTAGLAIGFVPNFISDHSYMQTPGRESDTYLLNDTVMDANSLLDWSTRHADYQALLQLTLGAQAAGVQVMATEFNSVNTNPGKQSTSLVNGLFIAESLGSLLDSGYTGGDVWDLRNGWDTTQNNSESLYGWRNGGDYGLLGSGNSPPATGNYVPYPTYFAEQLVSKMLQNGGTVVSAVSNYQDFDAYGVMESNGHLDLLLINTNPAAALNEQFNLAGFQPSGQASFWQYGIAQDTAQSQSSNGSAALANLNTTLSLTGNSFAYTLPAYSMTVIDLTPAPPALASLPFVNGGSAAINIVSASGNGTTATITTDGTPHGFWVGELVTLTGVTPGGSGGLAGTVTVLGVPSATTFQFASTYSGSETLSGATVTAALAGAQRSMVDSIVFNFTQPVTLTAAAFSINVIVDNTSTGDQVGVAPTLNVAPVPFTNEWVVTFSDPVNYSVIGNSIANGAYSITINPSLVTAVSNGQNLSAGETDTFYRLYGDLTGAQSVTNVDANAFNRAWGNHAYAAGYIAALDYNDGGRYTNIDANALNRAFNTRYNVATTI